MSRLCLYVCIICITCIVIIIITSASIFFSAASDPAFFFAPNGSQDNMPWGKHKPGRI